ncbi:MAG: hypothetical protein ABW194_08035 [Novosphingobium sp.]
MLSKRSQQMALTEEASFVSTIPVTRDYFAEMYVAGIMADAGWDIYFPRRDRGFDMIVSRPFGDGTIVRPVQVKGKYATDEKTNKAVYGYVGTLTALHDAMILAIPYFTSLSSHSPVLIAWLSRDQLKKSSSGWRCEPAQFVDGVPCERKSYRPFFGSEGLLRFATAC